MRARPATRAGLLAALALACAPALRRPPPDQPPTVPGLPAVPRRCLVANHVHTLVGDRYSHDPAPAHAAVAYSPAGLRSALAAFRRDGADAVVITDHNAIAALWDPATRREAAGLTVVPGMEWTTRRGHALLIGLRAQGPWDAPLPPPWRTWPSDQDISNMVQETHARGGLVVIAHPSVPFRTWPESHYGADGVEVWGLDSAWIRNEQAIARWQRWLAGGARLVALAGTDLHPGALLRRHRRPLNRVDAASCDVPALVAAIRAGHVLLVDDPGAPQLALGVESGGALDFADAVPGDRHPAGPVDLQARVLGGRGTTLRLFDRRGLFHSHAVTTDDDVVRLRLRADAGQFVRAELRRGRRLLALSNPIYFFGPVRSSRNDFSPRSTSFGIKSASVAPCGIGIGSSTPSIDPLNGSVRSSERHGARRIHVSAATPSTSASRHLHSDSSRRGTSLSSSRSRSPSGAD